MNATGRWSNWSGEQSCAPAVHEHPASVDDVRAAVLAAGPAGRTVRVAGAGHSFTAAVPTAGTLLSLDRMAGVLDADRASGLVRVQAGITLHALSERLAQLGLALENLGDIDAQTVAGALATATHGTGARLRNLSAQVEEIELVDGRGEVVRCSPRDDAEAWRAARVSVGALGVVTEVTLRCVPAFTLRRVDAPAPLEETLERLEETVAAEEHFEFFTFPYTDIALTRTSTRVDGPPAPPSRARRWLEDVALTNGAFGLACRAGRRFPRAIPRLNAMVTGAAGHAVRVDRSDRTFASPRLVRFTEMEYALPRPAVVPALRAVREHVERNRLAISFPFEVRFVAADDAFLSPAAGRDTAYLAVHVYRGMESEPFFRAAEAIFAAHDGRPHWGKRHFQTAATLAPRYPEWERFAAVRARLDPDGRFANAYVDRVLGAVHAPRGLAASGRQA
jgi:L-gulonolactone oxidase